MKIEIVFLLLLIITMTLIFKDLLRTEELEPQYRNLWPLKNKIKRAKSRTVYYSNTVARYNVILSGDIETNPGPGLRSRNNIPKCTVCWKGVGANRKRFECERCFNLTHINCTNISNKKQYHKENNIQLILRINGLVMTVLCRCFLFTNREMSKVNPPLKMIYSIHTKTTS